MIVTQFRVKRIAEPSEDAINQWQIYLTLKPTWIERYFFGKIKSETRTMVGSCISWKWGNDTKVDYLWSLWAHKIVRDRIKKAGTTYVNRRSIW
jgi:hypothetical protein